MRQPPSSARRRRRRALGALALSALALTSVAFWGLPGRGGVPRAVAVGNAGDPTPQTDNSVPAPSVTMIGSSPQEAPNETWGVGQVNGSGALVVRYTEAGWSLGPGLLDATGAPLSGFTLAQTTKGVASPLAGRVTPDGSGVLIGKVGEGPSEVQMLLVRDPGGSFKGTAALPEVGEAALNAGESLFSASRAPLIAALEESPTKAGALVVPVKGTGAERSVLRWDGKEWTREAIKVPAASVGDFRVLALAASSPTNAWLLAQLSSSGGYPVGAVALFRRIPGEGGTPATWVPVALKAGGEDTEAHPIRVPLHGKEESEWAPFTVAGTGEPPTAQAQILTVTGEGVWIDGERRDSRTSTTIFFKPEGTAGGHLAASWCPEQATKCTYELPEPLPKGPSRSFAWANPGGEGYGERVITGLPEGLTLRLEGSTFRAMLALGGGAQSFPGGAYGAAFSSPVEGWLGSQSLPVHLTRAPKPTTLTPWPVTFRKSLLAVAPQPGAPVAALASQAIAVGDQGEIARYQPGRGWIPESLIGVSGRRETPRLRAVAWPTPTRIYAVGDAGQMWLWRGETGLWEQDPATPVNFRGNLMGVAFDPNNSSRGYAVGESGVLLRYGKSWTQETSLPPAVAGASFTSIAFAGSEAIVAWRKLLKPNSESYYVGGLLVNNGSGWTVDDGAAAAMGSRIPSAVAALPDGGAAFVAKAYNTVATVYERQSAGTPWQPTVTPYPSGGQPGSLAVFREGGELRVIASGTAAGGFQVESQPPSPPGFPPPLIGPYGLGSNTESGVLRQTASGWSDEEHELNNVGEPPGHYKAFDSVYQPDPVAAMLVDPGGGQGWAVGGFVDGENGGALDTAEIARYRDASPPPGSGGSVVVIAHNEQNVPNAQAAFAIGGGAQCAAPCAERAYANIGPDVWMSTALQRAAAVAGNPAFGEQTNQVRAFLYTGPRVTNGETEGPAELAVPYALELERYAQVLRATPAKLPVFAAPSPTDLDGSRSELTFQNAFLGFPAPFGIGSLGGGASPISGTGRAPCEGCAATYYAFRSSGPTGAPVRVIVLDNTRDVEEPQLAWLRGELAAAAAASPSEPAIVLGNADLNAQIAAHDAAAMKVAEVLVGGSAASAYFFDSPEQNISEPLTPRPGARSIPSFGSGTLGYVDFRAENSGAFLGASGFLLAEVNTAPGARKANNVAPVTARLIPDIGELALEAKDGTLLARSHAALFEALARRPRAGSRSVFEKKVPETDPYIPIPSNCVGVACSKRLTPEYTFTSSRPDIGNFVKPNLASSDPHAVLLGPKGEPESDPTSGLFCAYNAGTTIVTISAGELSASLSVTVQAGSVRRPCGTVKLKELPVPPKQVAPPPPPGGPPPPATAPTALAPLLPLPPAPVLPPAPAPHLAAVIAPFIAPASLPTSLPAFVPLPPPSPARPTPPSGTSAVTSPVEAPQKEEEEEEATESVSNQAVAYRAPEHEIPPVYVLGVIVLAAFAGASIRRRPRGRGGESRVALATLNTTRAQRRMSARDRY